MWKYCCLLLFLLMPSISLSEEIKSRWVSECTYSKEVNGDASMELCLRGTIQLSDGFDVKLGVSEGYLAKRTDKYNFNHAGLRVDIGVLWDFYVFKIGYTHSNRHWFDGSYSSALFNYRDIDSITIRREW